MQTNSDQPAKPAKANDSRTASDKAVVCKELLGAWWEIPHPGTLEKLRCDTLKEAMDKWFEGFNIPVLVVDGVRESFDAACFRVSKYVNAPNAQAQRPARSPEQKGNDGK